MTNVPGTLMGMLRRLHRAWELETPPLDHSELQTDEGGAPVMQDAPAAYLGLLARRKLDRDARAIENPDAPDDTYKLACRVSDGHFVTPVRCAIARIGQPERRAFLRDLVAEIYFPSEIATIHGVPRWAASDVMYRSLVLLTAKYREIPETPVGWLARSDAQRNAETTAA